MKKYIMVIVLLSVQHLFAQWNFSLSTSQEYNSNPFRFKDAAGEFISSYNLGIEKQFEDINILYYGSYSTLSNTPGMNYYWHQAGLYSEFDKSTIGAYVEQRINGEMYEFYDANIFSAYYRTIITSEYINFKLNTAAVYTSYPNLSSFNNLLINASVTGTKSFETKTTLIGTAIFNYKSFKDEIDSVSLSGRGYQRGRNASMMESRSISLTQLELNGRIAQSLFENTGLAININYKKILSGSGIHVGVIESVYGETELYEDPVTQNGFSIGGIITQIIPLDIMLQAGYYYYDKSFPSQGTFLSDTLYDENLIRKDLQNNFYISASKIIPLDEEMGSSLNLSLNFGLINNNSNSYYYDYSSNMISFKIDYQF